MRYAIIANPTSPNRKLLIIQSIAGVFLFWMALYLFVPTLPIYAQSKTANLGMVGMALAQYGLWQAILRFPLGLAADRLGRRKVFILLGFVLTALGAWIMLSATGIGGVAIGRAVTGLAASSWVVLVVVYSGFYKPEEATRAAATLTLVNTLAQGTASLASGPLTQFGSYSAGFIAAMAAAGVGLLVFLPGREVRRAPAILSADVIRKLVVRRDVLGPALLNATQQYAIFTTIFSFTPILARSFRASNIEIGLLTTVNLAANVVGNLIASTMVRRVHARGLIYASFGLLAAGLALSAVAPSLLVLFLAQILVGMGGGIGFPILMGLSIAHVEESQRNTAMGLHQAVYGIGMFAGPWMSGLLASWLGIQPMFAITTVAILGLGFFGNSVVNRKNL